MEGIVSFSEFSLIVQAEAKIIVRLSIARVWISRCEASNSAREMFFGQCKLPCAKVHQSDCVVDACIAGVTSESFAPICVS